MASYLKDEKFMYAGKEISFTRLQRIQEAIADKTIDVDSILIISGIDGKFNDGTRKFLSVLLPEYGKIPKSLSRRFEFAEEVIEDLVICIKKDAIDVYCNPENHHLLLPYISCWRNLRVYCLDKDEYEQNEELSEDLKMISFLKMVEGCQVVGFPYSFQVKEEHRKKTFDPMDIEQWPLVQAYALDEIGGKGFFTMNHEVIDVSESIENSLSTLDTLSMEKIITKNLVQFGKQWQTMIAGIDMISEEEISKISESKLAEPLTTYYHHVSRRQTVDISKEPFVLFGTRTKKKILDSQVKESNTILKDSGLGNLSASHMICHGSDSTGIVSCTRTYFVYSADGQSKERTDDEKSNNGKDVRLLQELYLIAIEAVDNMIAEYCRTQDMKKAEMVAREIIGNGTRNLDFSPPKGDSIQISLTSSDLLGRKRESTNGTIKMAKITIYDIPSIVYPGQVLGSVAFAESFAISTIHLKDNQGSVNGFSSESIILTHGISRFFDTLSKQNPTELEEIGLNLKVALPKPKSDEYLIAETECVLVTGLWPSFERLDVNLVGLQEALIVRHKRFGDLVISCSHIKSWYLFDNESSMSTSLLLIYPDKKLMLSLPFWIRRNQSILLALAPRTNAHRSLYDNALHAWKDENKMGPPLKIMTVLPKEFSEMYAILDYLSKETYGKQPSLKTEMSTFPNLKRFFAHLELSSCGIPSLKKREFQRLLNNIEVENEEHPSVNDNELLLTIITGLPDSGSDTLCKALVSLARENSRWLVLNVPSKMSEVFNTKSFQEQLAVTIRNLTHQKGRPQVSSRKQRRVILQTQGFVDIKEIIAAIEEHPDLMVKSKLHIGAVTCCINPQSAFQMGRNLLPMLLEQCSAGYANNAVFTSWLEPNKLEELHSIQHIIRQCNPNIAFILAKGGEVTRTPDVHQIMSETAFNEMGSLRSRCIFYKPGNATTTTCRNRVEQITIHFHQPIEKSQFIDSLKDMKRQMSIEDLHQGKTVVYYVEGKLEFIEPPGEHEVKWCKLSGHLSLVPVSQVISPRPPDSPRATETDTSESGYHLTFFGEALQEKWLKDFLRKCQPQKKQFIKKEDISKEKLNEIEKSHKLDTLPPGWFYSGTQYVNFDGKKLFQHPLLHTFIDEYLEKVNDIIRKDNDEVSHITETDMFKE